jgi:hypothetical protein
MVGITIIGREESNRGHGVGYMKEKTNSLIQLIKEMEEDATNADRIGWVKCPKCLTEFTARGYPIHPCSLFKL